MVINPTLFSLILFLGCYLTTTSLLPRNVCSANWILKYFSNGLEDHPWTLQQRILVPPHRLKVASGSAFLISLKDQSTSIRISNQSHLGSLRLAQIFLLLLHFTQSIPYFGRARVLP